MTERELIRKMAEEIEADAKCYDDFSPPDWDADIEEAKEIYREKITALRMCTSLEQVSRLAKVEIPLELEDHKRRKSWVDEQQEALISISNWLGAFLAQVEERGLLTGIRGHQTRKKTGNSGGRRL